MTQSKYIVKVHIFEGKHFGYNLQAIQWYATFGSETKVTTYSVGTDYHVWNTPFQWSIDREQLRKVSGVVRGVMPGALCQTHSQQAACSYVKHHVLHLPNPPASRHQCAKQPVCRQSISCHCHASTANSKALCCKSVQKCAWQPSGSGARQTGKMPLLFFLTAFFALKASAYQQHVEDFFPPCFPLIMRRMMMCVQRFA